MNKKITVIAAISLLAFPLSGGSAETYRHHAKRYARHHFAYNPGYPEYYARQYDSNHLPIGSGAWWRQMLRENRVRN